MMARIKKRTVNAVSRESDQLVIRLPDGMRDKLKRAASDNLRSMNSEAIIAIARYLVGAPTDAKSNGHLSAEQIRGARAMLRMEQKQLAQQSGVSVETIKRLEGTEGPLKAQSDTLKNIQGAFEALGILFFEGRVVEMVSP